MTKARYLEIASRVKGIKTTLRRWGSIKRNHMTRVSITELAFLQKHFPELLPFTRIFDYTPDERIEDFNVPQRSKPPVIREIWVGARSLAAQGEDSDLSEGMSENSMDQEDMAELTELQTLTYDDKAAFDAWIKAAKKRLGRNDFKYMMDRIPRDKYGNTVPVMIEDPETGEYRPIFNNDVIQVAWGSNEDLDALYMEEPADPRSESDALTRELTRGQVRANNHMENEMMPSKLKHIIPASALPEGLNHKMDDIARWQVAHNMVDEYLVELSKADKTTEFSYRQLADMAFSKLLKAEGDIKFDSEGNLTHGRFINRQDYWDAVERNMRQLEAPKRTVTKQYQRKDGTKYSFRFERAQPVAVPKEIYHPTLLTT